MSTAIRRSLPLAISVVVAGGLLFVVARSCVGAASFNYDGHWKGNRNLVSPDANPYILHTVGAVELTIKDNRFDLIEKGIPSSGPVEYLGNHIELHTDSIMLRGIDRASPEVVKDHPDVTVTPQPDGTLLYDNPAAVDHKPLKLIREKK